MHPAKYASSSRATLVLLACLVVQGCGVSLQRATAVAVEQTSVGLLELRDHVEAERQSGRMTPADYEAWKRRLGRVGRAGKALTVALAKGNGHDAATQVRALLDLIDDLVKEDVVKLSPGQQIPMRIAIESVRSALLVISALTGSALPPADPSGA